MGGFVGDGGNDLLVARSPEFEITAPGLITIDALGGHGSNAQDPGTGTDPYDNNEVGVSLVRALDGVRVLSERVNYEGTATQIAMDISPFVNDGNSYFLEVVDNYSGGWGYVEFDNFVIPYASSVPEPSTLLLASLGIASMVLVLRRRRK